MGPEQEDVEVGQWILVEHGRWTRGVKVDIDNDEFTLRRIDGDAVMIVSDELPPDDTVSTAVDGNAQQRIDWSQQ